MFQVYGNGCELIVLQSEAKVMLISARQQLPKVSVGAVRVGDYFVTL